LNLKPADEYCPNGQTSSSCTRADLFAFQISCGAFLTYTAYIGMTSWHITKSAHKAIPSTLEGRLFGHIPDAEQLMVIVFSFQFWDLIVSMMIPEHNAFLFLAHHFMAALIAYFSLEYQVSLFFIHVSWDGSCKGLMRRRKQINSGHVAFSMCHKRIEKKLSSSPVVCFLSFLFVLNEIVCPPLCDIRRGSQ